MDKVFSFLSPPTGFQNEERPKLSSQRITPLSIQPGYFQPPPPTRTPSPPLSKLALHPLFSGQNPLIVQLKNENPDCAKLIDYCIQRFGSKIPEKFKLIFAEKILQTFRRRTNRRTQEQIIQLVQQPCFEIESDAFFQQARVSLEQTEGLDEESQTQFISNMLDAFSKSIVDGIDEVYYQEISSENGIVTHPKTHRGVEKWSRKPCAVHMSAEDYNKLKNEDKILVNESYKKYGIQTQRVAEALGMAGGKKQRKTRKYKRNRKHKTNKRKKI